MSLRVLLPVLAVTLVGASAGLWAFDTLRPADLFAWSGIVVPAALTALFTLGLAMLLPHSLLYSPEEQAGHALRDALAKQPGMTLHVLKNIQQARDQAKRLHAAKTGLRADIAQLTEAAARDLEALADQLGDEPARAGSMMPLIARADLVVEAVESFVELKSRPGADSTTVDGARAKVAATLERMSLAAGAAQTRLARQNLIDLEVATEVADGLLHKTEHGR